MYTIKQVSEKMKISAHTLRFYANEGLFPYISRDKNNVRLFSEQDLEWVKMVQCLRDTEMPLDEVKHFIELSKQGDGTVEERYHIILKQKQKAEHDIEEMQKRLEILKWKENYYKNLLETHEPDVCNPEKRA